MISIYVDTNFLLDCSEGRDDNSSILMKKIRDKKYKCLTSAYTMMEISDFKKDEIYFVKKFQKKWSLKKILSERYKKDLRHDDFEDVSGYIKNKIINSYPVETININEEGWRMALEINIKSNIAIGDAIHLATAWNSGCKYLVTSDKNFIENSAKILEELKVSTISVISPKDFLDKKRL